VVVVTAFGSMETAVAAIEHIARHGTGLAEVIVTNNVSDFRGSELRFSGLRVLKPAEFMEELTLKGFIRPVKAFNVRHLLS
jgi:class 3 adenylate cyclase